EGIVNVVGRDRLSRIDLARRLARTFSLDESLLRPLPTRRLGQRAARPLEGGLSTDRLERLLGTGAMPLDEALKRVRRRWRADTHVAGEPAARGSEAEALRQ